MCTYIPNIHVYVDQVIGTHKHVLNPPYMGTRNRVPTHKGESVHIEVARRVSVHIGVGCMIIYIYIYIYIPETFT